MDDFINEDEDNDYGYFCDESEEVFQTTNVEWKEYDENNYIHVDKKYSQFEGGDIESIYSDSIDSFEDGMNDLSFKKSINNIYIMMLKMFYCAISYITIFIHKVKP